MEKSRYVTGRIHSARILDEQPSFIHREKLHGARAVGVRYEEKALNKLEERLRGSLEWTFARSPWLEYVDDSGRRWCQPDAVLLAGEGVDACVVEIKYRHTADAWFQIWKLYIPVLSLLFPERTWRGCEMVKWYDPTTSFPEPVVLTPDPLRTTNPKLTAVHIWNPARDQ